MTARSSGGAARRVLRTTITLCGAAAVTGTIALSLASSAGAAAPACSSSGLVIWINTQANGAAGTTFYSLRFTNLSGRSCTLRGYPGVSAVSLAGRQIGRPASRLSNGRVRTVTVGVGKTVNADVGFFDADAIPRSHCRPVLAAGLRVFAPNTSTAKFVPFPSTVCSRGGSLRIGRVQR